MIIFIILASIFVISLIAGIVLLIIDNHTSYYTRDASMIGFCVAACDALLALIIGVVVLCVNSRQSYVYTYNELANKVEYLNDTKHAIENAYDSNSDSIYLTVSISEYNKEVANYKSAVQSAQYTLSNPWCNWFENKAYLEFSADDVEYFKGD